MSLPTALQQGRYQIRYEMNRDACGILFLALDTKMAHREVLVRQITDSRALPLLERIARLSHPTLPSVYDLFEEREQRYLVLEYASGQTLADVVLGPPLQVGAVLAWARQIAAGLTFLHQQRPTLAHGDLQPSNVVLQDGRRIKLIGGVPSGCIAAPTGRYSAPERWQGAPPSPLSDIYAFGATVHHLLTGVDPNSQPLHSFAPPAQQRPELPAALSAAVMRALSSDPQQRFASADAFMQALQASAASGQLPSDVPAIGFTPSAYPANTGPTRQFSGQSGAQPTSAPQQRAGQSSASTAQLGPNTEMGSYPPPPPPSSRLPQRPDERGGTAGPLFAGVALALLIVALIGFFLWRALTHTPAGTGTSVVAGGVNLPTTTRDEGRPLTAPELTATALAGQPSASATPINSPTIGPDQQTAEAEGTALVATATAATNNLEALYNLGVAQENTGQFVAAAATYTQILASDPNYRDTAIRLQTVPTYLNATATAEVATATAAAQPTLTPTPEPTFTPTPTPAGLYFGDTFEGPLIDMNTWTTYANSGTIALRDGALELKAENGTCFPLVTAADSVSFPAGDFDLLVRFRYADVTPLGTGIMFSTSSPERCGDSDRAGAHWFGVWQDAGSGLFVDFHRAAEESGLDLKDIRYPFTQGEIDTNMHTFRVTRRGNVDTFYLDTYTLFEEQANQTIQVVWFGNPAQISSPNPWSTLIIDEFQLTTPCTSEGGC